MSLTPAQMKIRRTRIGASEIGALLGIDPYKSVLDVFMEKVCPEKVEPKADHRTLGLDLEIGILAAHARKTGLVMVPPPGTITHPIQPLCCTPDGLGLHDGLMRVVQAKNVRWSNAGGWGEPGTDDAPMLYVAQVTVEVGVLLAVANAEAWQEEIDATGDLVALIGGDGPHCYPIRIDADLFGVLAERAAKFVVDHLQTGKPPEDWHEDRSALEYVQRRWPKNMGAMIPATDEARALAEEMAVHGYVRRQAETVEKSIKAQLAAMIGEADGIEGLVTWRKDADSVKTVTDWEAGAKEWLGPEAIADIEKRHTTTQVTRKGGRKMRLLGAEKEED